MSEFYNFSDDGIVGYFWRCELTNKILNSIKNMTIQQMYLDLK